VLRRGRRRMAIDLEGTRRDREFTELDCGETLYVHLCSGEIIEVRPATSVRVTSESVEALDGSTVVASFARDDVYLAVDVPMEPPPLE
jgi:hypothetical protein